MGIESGCTGGGELVGSQDFFKTLPLRFPVVVPSIENLREPAPTDVSNQLPLFDFGGRSLFQLKPLEQFNRSQVVLALLSE